MTVTALVPKNAYTAAGGTVFPYTFTIFDATEILVYVNGALTSVGFTVDNVGVIGGGNVTFTVAPANGTKILFVRQTLRSQATDWTANDSDPAESKERAFDKLTNIAQEQDDILNRIPQYKVDNASIVAPRIDTPVVGQFLRHKDSTGNVDSAVPIAIGTISNPVSLAQGGTSSNYASALALAAGLNLALWKPGADLTAAATLALPNPLDGNIFNVNGSTTVTAIATAGVNEGTVIYLRIVNTPQFTHGANLQMMGATSPVFSGGETLLMQLKSAVWREIHRSKGFNIADASKFWRGDGTWQDIPGSLAWVTPAYNAGDFTGGGAQTWTVDAGDVTTYAYNIRGKTMTLSFKLVNTTIAGTPNPALQIKIPGGFTSAKIQRNLISISNAGVAVGFAETTVGGTVLQCFKDLNGTTNWAAEVNVAVVVGQITFEVQ